DSTRSTNGSKSPGETRCANRSTRSTSTMRRSCLDRLTLGRPRHDLRIVDVVLVDLFAQRVSPGDFEPFVLLVESDGALHLVATQALEIHLLIRVHRLMCLCGHGGLPFLLSSVALVELPQHSIQLLHFPDRKS